MQKTIARISVALAAALALGAVTSAESAEGTGGGSVSGTVKLSGKPPQKKAKDVTKDGKACGRTQPDETYVVGAGGVLANVVITLEGAAGGPRSLAPVELDNRDCRFVPHVTAFLVGTPLVMKNSDGILHTTHLYDADGSVANFALPNKGDKVTKTLEDPGIYRFGCDAGHTWMSGYAVVTETPFFAVTGKDGTFSLTGVPPGSYAVKAWHEAAGVKTAKITVTQGAAATIDITF